MQPTKYQAEFNFEESMTPLQESTGFHPQIGLRNSNVIDSVSPRLKAILESGQNMTLNNEEFN